MTLLENHLEQISLSATSVADLQFPPPKIFTNALLGHHEITTLIRDTEPHERALFSLDPGAANGSTARNTRRQTITTGNNVTGSSSKTIYGSSLESKKLSAVARVLGPEMLLEIQQCSGSTSQARPGAGGKVNVEVLLRGAEKLCQVYPVQGAAEKIASLRSRHNQTATSIAHYEEQVLKQQARLDRMNKGANYEQGNGVDEGEVENNSTEPAYTESDIRAEEQEIQELEAKKKALELRVAGMEKDLGGLLR